MSRAVGAHGFIEVLSSPFMAPSVHDELGVPDDDPRRAALRIVNPLSEAEPLLRTTLLPGLLADRVAQHRPRRTRSRDRRDRARVPQATRSRPAPVPAIAQRPSDAEIAAIYAACPTSRATSPPSCAAISSGAAGPARPGAATWADAVEVCPRGRPRGPRRDDRPRCADTAPWHPGRCAELLLDDTVIGYAGELHPRAIAAFGLPERTCAVELVLDAFAPPGPAPAPAISSLPARPARRCLGCRCDDARRPRCSPHCARASGRWSSSVRLFDAYATSSDSAPVSCRSPSSCVCALPTARSPWTRRRRRAMRRSRSRPSAPARACAPKGV